MNSVKLQDIRLAYTPLLLYPNNELSARQSKNKTPKKSGNNSTKEVRHLYSEN